MKVFIFHVPVGNGHTAAANAVAAEFLLQKPDADVRVIDLMTYAPCWFTFLFVDFYFWSIRNFPALWRKLFHFMDKRGNLNWLLRLSRGNLGKRLIDLLRTEKPDLIIATHPLATLLITDSRQKDVINIPSAVIVTDYGCHNSWIDQTINYFFVATGEVKSCLSGYGVDATRVYALGMPVSQKFLTPIASENSQRLLIAPGQFIFEELDLLLQTLTQKIPQLRFTIVCGKDEALLRSLQQSMWGNVEIVGVHGFVDNMHELMSSADLIVTKAGGMTVTECLIKELPMIFWRVIPGQEEYNVDYLTRHGAAIQVRTLEELIACTGNLLGDQSKLSAMKKACSNLARPQATHDIVSTLISSVSSEK